MTKLSLFGIAAVAAYAALAVPAFAQQKTGPATNLYAQRDVCGTTGYRGNPYNREIDYWSWSSWRGRGGWDARNDYKCIR